MAILMKNKDSEFKVYCNKVSIENNRILIPDYISYDLLSVGSGMSISIKEISNYEFVQAGFSFDTLNEIVSKRIKGEENTLFTQIGNPLTQKY